MSADDFAVPISRSEGQTKNHPDEKGQKDTKKELKGILKPSCIPEEEASPQ
jgi:hypothetical protein